MGSHDSLGDTDIRLSISHTILWGISKSSTAGRQLYSIETAPPTIAAHRAPVVPIPKNADEVEDELPDEVEDEVEDELPDEVEDELLDEVEDEVEDPDEAGDELPDEAGDEVGDEVGDEGNRQLLLSQRFGTLVLSYINSFTEIGFSKAL